MTDPTAIKNRYLRDSIPIRLGGLAANLSRIKSFSNHPGHQDIIESLLEESKYFIEWTSSDISLEDQAMLAELQIQLALWQWQWKKIWDDPTQRTAVAEKAHNWSKIVLKMSGLLK